MILMALNYGVCFIPQELGVHRVLKNSRPSASRSNPETHLQEVSPMWKLMDTTYADRFPPRFRKSLRGRHLHEYGAMASKQCEKSLEEFLVEIKTSLDSRSVIDHLFCIGVRTAIKAQLFLIKAYLFFRLRKINIDVLMRIIYRRGN